MKILVGISSCLVGQQVRFDGGHKRNRFITETLSDIFDFETYCPEVAIGLGIPRPTIRLESRDKTVHAIIPKLENKDVTDSLQTYGINIGLQTSHLSGYIFKSKSPSCGMERVKVYNEKGFPDGTSPGIYAAEIMKANPLLPCEEEGRLNDPGLRDNFIERVFAYQHWRELNETEPKINELIKFHSAYKYQLMAHDQTATRALGRIVATASTDLEQSMLDYVSLFMQTLKKQASRKNQVNALQHIMGYFKHALDKGDKEELTVAIENYRLGKAPLIVPLTLIRHHQRRMPDDYIARQKFLEESKV